jgi:hypothetical protein
MGLMGNKNNNTEDYLCKLARWIAETCSVDIDKIDLDKMKDYITNIKNNPDDYTITGFKNLITKEDSKSPFGSNAQFIKITSKTGKRPTYFGEDTSELSVLLLFIFDNKKEKKEILRFQALYPHNHSCIQSSDQIKSLQEEDIDNDAKIPNSASKISYFTLGNAYNPTDNLYTNKQERHEKRLKELWTYFQEQFGNKDTIEKPKKKTSIISIVLYILIIFISLFLGYTYFTDDTTKNQL